MGKLQWFGIGTLHKVKIKPLCGAIRAMIITATYSPSKYARQLPHVRPPPKASKSIKAPFFSCPFSYNSLIAIGIDAADVFPYFSTVKTTFSSGRPTLSPTALIIL